MPGSIKIDDGSGNYTILTNAGSLGSDKTITIPNETATLATTNGITEIDTWALTATVNSNGDITSNLARYNGTNSGYKGTGMTQSSGVFTFPSTGIWLVRSNIQYMVTNQANRYAQTFIHGTTDNFSSVDNKLTENGTNIPAISGANYIDVSGQTLVDCTDTSNIKVKFGFNYLIF